MEHSIIKEERALEDSHAFKGYAKAGLKVNIPRNIDFFAKADFEGIER